MTDDPFPELDGNTDTDTGTEHTGNSGGDDFTSGFTDSTGSKFTAETSTDSTSTPNENTTHEESSTNTNSDTESSPSSGFLDRIFSDVPARQEDVDTEYTPSLFYRAVNALSAILGLIFYAIMYLAEWVIAIFAGFSIVFGPIILFIGIPLMFFDMWLSLGAFDFLQGLSQPRKFHVTLLFILTWIVAGVFAAFNDEQFG